MNAEQNAREAMEAPTMTDYMQMALEVASTAPFDQISDDTPRWQHGLARTLEALDTERAAHEATKAELQTTKAMMQAYALDKMEAEAELQALREALEPFQTFAECHIDEEGWTGPMKTTRIVDWFGPSDFRALTRKDA